MNDIAGYYRVGTELGDQINHLPTHCRLSRAHNDDELAVNTIISEQQRKSFVVSRAAGVHVAVANSWFERWADPFVERLGRLVKQLLDLSRLESGVVPLERTEFRVEPLLTHAVREQQLHAPEVPVQVSVDASGKTFIDEQAVPDDSLAAKLAAIREAASGGAPISPKPPDVFF